MKNILNALSRHKIAIIPALAASIYILFCALNITNSTWFDEGFSAILTRFNFDKIWQLTAADVHPPLYYFALKLWQTLFGSTDYALRFMSVFFGALTIVTAFFFVRYFFSQKAACFAAFFLAFCPPLIRYGQEMRMYTMTIFLVMLGTFLFALALKTQKRHIWLLYGVIVSLGMWTHYFSAFAWLSHVIFLLLHYHKTKGQKTVSASVKSVKNLSITTKITQSKIFNFFANPILAYAGAVLLYLPWFPMFISQSKRVQGGFWISPVGLHTFPEFIQGAILGENYLKKPSEIIIFWLILGFFVIITSILFKKIKKQQGTAPSPQTSVLLTKILLFLSVIPPLFLFIISLPPLKPTFVNRYLLYSGVAIWLLLSLIIAQNIKKVNINPTKSTKKNTIKTLKIPISAPATVAMIVTAIFSCVGIYKIETRTPDSFAKNAIFSALATDKSLPILLGDNMTAYHSLTYRSEKSNNYTAKIHFIKSWQDIAFLPTEPLYALPSDFAYDSFADFTAKHKHFWLIQSRDTKKPLDDQKFSGTNQTLHSKTELTVNNYVITEIIVHDSEK